MIITKMALPRRTFLRGVGRDAGAAVARRDGAGAVGGGRTAAKPVHRYGFFYMPNGVAMNHTGVNYLEAHDRRRGLRVLADSEAARAVPESGDRGQRAAQSLGREPRRRQRRPHAQHRLVADRRRTSSEPKAPICGRASRSIRSSRRSSGRRRRCRRSSSRFFPNSVTGGCDTGYSCAYGTTLAWASPTTPLPTQSSPRLVFEQLFGDGGPASQQLAALRTKNSILDSAIRRDGQAADEAGRRRTARRSPTTWTCCARSSAAFSRPRRRTPQSPLPEYERPGIGVPERFDDHTKLMFDLQCLAFQGDITRVTTFMYGAEQRGADVSGDRVERIASLDVAPRRQSREPGEVRQVVHLARAACSRYLIEKMRATPGRRRQPARSLADDDRRRHEQRQHPLAHGRADRAGRRRRRAQGQPPRRDADGHAVVQSARELS